MNIITKSVALVFFIAKAIQSAIPLAVFTDQCPERNADSQPSAERELKETRFRVVSDVILSHADGVPSYSSVESRHIRII